MDDLFTDPLMAFDHATEIEGPLASDSVQLINSIHRSSA
jgi:hypothetical protein